MQTSILLFILFVVAIFGGVVAFICNDALIAFSVFVVLEQTMKLFNIVDKASATQVRVAKPLEETLPMIVYEDTNQFRLMSREAVFASFVEKLVRLAAKLRKDDIFRFPAFTKEEGWISAACKPHCKPTATPGTWTALVDKAFYTVTNVSAISAVAVLAGVDFTVKFSCIAEAEMIQSFVTKQIQSTKGSSQVILSFTRNDSTSTLSIAVRAVKLMPASPEPMKTEVLHAKRLRNPDAVRNRKRKRPRSFRVPRLIRKRRKRRKLRHFSTPVATDKKMSAAKSSLQVVIQEDLTPFTVPKPQLKDVNPALSADERRQSLKRAQKIHARRAMRAAKPIPQTMADQKVSIAFNVPKPQLKDINPALDADQRRQSLKRAQKIHARRATRAVGVPLTQ